MRCIVPLLSLRDRVFRGISVTWTDEGLSLLGSLTSMSLRVSVESLIGRVVVAHERVHGPKAACLRCARCVLA